MGQDCMQNLKLLYRVTDAKSKSQIINHMVGESDHNILYIPKYQMRLILFTEAITAEKENPCV